MKNFLKKNKLAAALSTLGFLSMMGTTHAALFEIDFSNSGAFSGTAPSTPIDPNAIYAKAIFDDGGGSGTVTLTMTVFDSLLPSAAYVNEWYFNVGTAPLSGINFVSGVAASAIDNGTDAFKADGTGGKFDFAFHFPTKNPGELAQASTSVYTLTGAGIGANSFNSLSIPAPQGGHYVGAIHVSGYEGTSVWVSGDGITRQAETPQIPEPATIALLGLGLLGMVVTRRRY